MTETFEGTSARTERSTAASRIPRDKAPEPALSGNPIASERYWSTEFAQREADALWTRVWQVAGRVDQVPEPGDDLPREPRQLCLRDGADGSGHVGERSAVHVVQHDADGPLGEERRVAGGEDGEEA